MKKTITILTLILTAILFLSGCSPSAGSSKEKANGDQISFWSLAKSKKTRIWFLVEDMKKDGDVYKAYVTQNGKITEYHLSNNSLSDFDNKNEKKVLDLIKKQDKENYKNEIQKYKEMLVDEQNVLPNLKKQLANNPEIAKALQYDVESTEKAINNYTIFLENTQYSKPVAHDIKKIDLTTDDSGNNVVAEDIIFKSTLYDSRNKSPLGTPDELAGNSGDQTTLELKSTISPKEILSKYYVGYSTFLNAKDLPSGPYLVTVAKDTTTTIQFDDGKDSIFTKD